jgi:hypothetical protein
MPTTTAIGAWDDDRLFPMLQDYLKRSAPREPALLTRHLKMLREIDLDTFCKIVTLANRFNGRH